MKELEVKRPTVTNDTIYAVQAALVATTRNRTKTSATHHAQERNLGSRVTIKGEITRHRAALHRVRCPNTPEEVPGHEVDDLQGP